MTTDRDYADMVDPFVRAEVEAFKRGYGQGIVTGIFYALWCGIVAALLLFAMKVEAAEWTYEESRRVLKASERGAQISVCYSSGVATRWQCFLVKEGK